MTRQLDLGQALAQAFRHYEQGRPAEARTLARELGKRQPALPGLAYLQGLLALDEGQPRKAAQHLAKALAATPGAPPLLLAMARAQEAQGRLDEAEALLRRLPGIAPAEESLAALLLRRGRAAEAAALLRPLEGRQSPIACNLLGLAEKSLGDLAAAALAFARALDLDPAHAPAQANLAAVLRLLKRPDEARAAAQRAVDLAPAAASFRLELALAEKDLEHWSEALAALDGAETLTEALWLQGECLDRLGRSDEAAAAWRRLLKADPADPFGAALAPARLEAGPAPDRAPSAFVTELYERYAEVFDEDLLRGLAYRGPALLLAAVTASLGQGPFDVLDLGCGTGLVGAAFAPHARSLHGLDLSPAMLDKARERGCYQRLDEGDLLAAARFPGAYDLVTAGDVLIYLGDLAPVFSAVAAALRPGGAFAFSVERIADGDDWTVLPSRRFGHSAAYLRRLAAAQGFTVLRLDAVSTRTEQGQPVPGLLMLVRKTETSSP